MCYREAVVLQNLQPRLDGAIRTLAVGEEGESLMIRLQNKWPAPQKSVTLPQRPHDRKQLFLVHAVVPLVRQQRARSQQHHILQMVCDRVTRIVRL
jgi:hypothetical protein